MMRLYDDSARNLCEAPQKECIHFQKKRAIALRSDCFLYHRLGDFFVEEQLGPPKIVEHVERELIAEQVLVFTRLNLQGPFCLRYRAKRQHCRCM